jgi:signal peptidase I
LPDSEKPANAKIQVQARLLDVFLPGAGTLLFGNPALGRLVMSLWMTIQLALISLVLTFTLNASKVLIIDLILWVILQVNLQVGLNSFKRGRAESGTGKNNISASSIILILLMYVAIPAIFMASISRHVQTITVNDFGTFPAILPGETLLVVKPGKLTAEVGRLVAWSSDVGWTLGRIVGTGGDKIEVREGEVFVNGMSSRVGATREVSLNRYNLDLDSDARESADLRIVTEQHGDPDKVSVAFFREGVTTGDVRAEVPEGKVFILSDNRSTTVALDSRDVGPVSIEQIKGTPLLVIWSRGQSFFPRLERIGAYWQ